MTAVAKPAAWYNNAWGARAKITISKDLAVGSTQANYPFKLTSLHNVIYGLSRSDGQDIVVTDSGGVNEIERDVASFDRLSRAAELYIKLPSMSSVEDPVIYLYFNNPDYYRGNDRVDRSITRRIRVAASADDCRVYYRAAVGWAIAALTDSIDMAGYYDATYYKEGCGMRYLSLLSPRYSVVNQSYIKFTCSGATAGAAANTRFVGELSGTPATFSTLANYQARRGTDVGGADDTQRTVAEVSWDAIAAWGLDVEYDSPSLNTILQEIVNASSLTNVALFWDDHEDRSVHAANNYRRGYAIDAHITKCPLLVCNFTPVVTNYQTIELQYLGLEGNL